MLTQLGYKINTLAVYLTRGMKELSTFNKFMGGKDKTIYGLTERSGHGAFTPTHSKIERITK